MTRIRSADLRKFWKRSATLVLLIAFLIVLLGALFGRETVAYADEVHRIITYSSTTVKQGETVADMVVIGNDAHIAGTVTDNLIVINGTAYLASTAQVDSVIDIGGQVLREPGAKINNAYTLTFNRPLLNSTVLGAALIAFLAGLLLTFSAAIVLIPVVLSLLLKPWLQTPSQYLEKSVRRMGGIGLLTTLGVIAITIALSATLIGIPLAGLIGILYLFLGIVGLTNVTVFIGKSLLNAFTKQKQIWIQSLTGATLIMAFANIPVIGWLIFACVWIVGVGTVTTWMWRIRRRNKH